VLGAAAARIDLQPVGSSIPARACRADGPDRAQARAAARPLRSYDNGFYPAAHFTADAVLDEYKR
jgi:hypothetical protein